MGGCAVESLHERASSSPCHERGKGEKEEAEKEDTRRRTGARQAAEQKNRGAFVREGTSQTTESPKQDPEKDGVGLSFVQCHPDNKQKKRTAHSALQTAKGDPLSRCFGVVTFPLVKAELYLN